LDEEYDRGFIGGVLRALDWFGNGKELELLCSGTQNEKDRLLEALEISTIPRFILVTSSGWILSYKAPQSVMDGFGF
jgi:hypothetical protein